MTPQDIIIDSAAVRPDESFMFIAHTKDEPDVLYAYDKVNLKTDCEGGVYLEYTMSVSSKKNKEVNQLDLDSKGQEIIQYLFETATGTSHVAQ